MFAKFMGLALVVGSMSVMAGAATAHHRSGDTTTSAAPEIDPGSAMTGLTMLASGLVILRGRRNKK